ncbi:MAG TPA: carbohydrate kinase [Terriglobales bacterium]|nr:carbohydrate kinase [Terriglobales bacterium]
MAEPALVVGLGEVLWDMLPSGNVLGGAPANFAYMANVLGDRGIVASRVGCDELGREACSAMQALGLDTSYVQQDEIHETGSANVSIDPMGQPNFTIKKPVAWDFMEWTSSWEDLSTRADVVCFGSLAQRSSISAATIEQFLLKLRKNALKVFDANLRQSFYSQELLCRSFQYADIAKINEQELLEVAVLLKLGSGTEEIVSRRLLREFDLKLVCLTRGARGSLLVSEDQTVEHQGFQVEVADAIGAGDAFAACLVHDFLRGNSLVEISERANRFASWVATQTGATPSISSPELQSIIGGNPTEVKIVRSRNGMRDGDQGVL